MSIEPLSGFACWEFPKTFLQITSLQVRMWDMNLCKWYCKTCPASKQTLYNKAKNVDDTPANHLGKYRHLLLDVNSACKNRSQQSYFTLNGEQKEYLQDMFSLTQTEKCNMVHMNHVLKIFCFSSSAEGAQSNYVKSYWDKCPWRNLVLRVRLLVS